MAGRRRQAGAAHRGRDHRRETCRQTAGDGPLGAPAGAAHGAGRRHAGAVIQSDVMDGTGEPGKGLTGASFRHGVEFREHASPNPRVAHVAIADVAAHPGRRHGRCRVRRRHAVRGRHHDGRPRLEASYQVSKGRLLLTGKVGTQSPAGAGRPHHGRREDRHDVRGAETHGDGEVQSVMKPSKKAQDAAGAKGAGGGASRAESRRS